MLEANCGCETTYQQPKLFDRDHLLIICVDCGEVVDEIRSVAPLFAAQLKLFSTESTE